MSDAPQIARRQLRFSLRAMLVAMTLLCVAFGFLGRWVHRSVRQRQAVAELGKSLGVVNVIYSYELGEDYELRDCVPPGPAWLRQFLGIDYLATVTAVEFYHADGDRLQALQDLPDLRALDLGFRHEATDSDLAPLKVLTCLRKLKISGGQVSGDGLDTLKSLTRLEQLSLFFDRATDDGMAHVGKITSLRKLEINECYQVTNSGVAELRQLKNLNHLVLGFTDNITDEVLEPLQSLANLRDLELTYRFHKGGEGLKYLAGYQRLESLKLYGGDCLTDAAFSNLPAMPGLKNLALVRCNALTNDSLKNLAKLTNLESLHLSCAQQYIAITWPKIENLSNLGDTFELTDAGLKHIGQISNLRKLKLTACGEITDEGLASLARLSNLEELEIEVDQLTQLSAAARANLGRALPKCRIDYQKLMRGF